MGTLGNDRLCDHHAINTSANVWRHWWWSLFLVIDVIFCALYSPVELLQIHLSTPCLFLMVWPFLSAGNEYTGDAGLLYFFKPITIVLSSAKLVTTLTQKFRSQIDLKAIFKPLICSQAHVPPPLFQLQSCTLSTENMVPLSSATTKYVFILTTFENMWRVLKKHLCATFLR